MNNKALLGLFVVLFAVFGFIYFTRDRINLFGIGNFNFIGSQQTNDKIASGSAESSDDMEATPSADIARSPETGLSGSSDDAIMSTRTACTLELYAQDCSTVEKTPICGYEKIVATSGISSERALTYISSCHYCKLYAPDGKLTMGEQTIYSQGYEQGSCTQ